MHCPIGNRCALRSAKMINRIFLYILCMVTLLLNSCKEAAKETIETKNEFQGFPDADSINLSPEQNLPIGN